VIETGLISHHFLSCYYSFFLFTFVSYLFSKCFHRCGIHPVDSTFICPTKPMEATVKSGV